VQEKLAGKLVDTAAGPDFSIVNPKRLPVTLQMSICQRCHMQGNAVLKPGKSFFDFKPGMLLEDVVSVFLPRYEGDQSNFTMASHPDRLMQSSCFKKSGEQLSCISCHNPHKSIEITPADHYNQACGQCHSAKDPCSLPMAERLSASNNCISCHMPKSGTSDIPHVTITDHWIRRPEAANQKKRSSVFVGLSSINEKQPAPLTMAMAWLQYYERFDGKRKSLDSAFHYLAAAESSANRQDWFEAKIHALYLKGDAAAVIRLIRQESASAAASRGWTAYRIGEMQLQSNQLVEAKSYFQKAVEGMPFQLDFQLKLAIAEMQTNQPSEARRRLERVLEEQPDYVPAMSNLGFIYLQMGEDQLAEKWYRKALQLDPDNQAATMNMIGLHLYRGEKGIAKQKLEQLLKKYPRHLQAQQILQSIS
jgi:Flp pilus assembly protein TadD